MQYLFLIAFLAAAGYFLYSSYDSEAGFDPKKGVAALAALAGAAASWFAELWVSLPF